MKQYLITAIVAIFALMVAFPSMSAPPGAQVNSAPHTHYHSEQQ